MEPPTAPEIVCSEEQLFAAIRARKRFTLDPALKELNFAYYWSSETGLEHQAEVITEVLNSAHKVLSLNLSHNEIGSSRVDIGVALKTNKSLTHLDLSYNKLGLSAAKALAEGVRNSTSLTSLNLSHNKIDGTGAATICKALKSNTTLRALNLGANCIGSQGAQAVMEALKANHLLTNVDISDNDICPQGAGSIATALKSGLMKTLSLNLSANNFGLKGAQSIIEALRGISALNSLGFSDIDLDDSGAEALAEALKLNKNLVNLTWDDHRVSSERIAQSIRQALQKNQTRSMNPVMYKLTQALKHFEAYFSESLPLTIAESEPFLKDNALLNSLASALRTGSALPAPPTTQQEQHFRSRELEALTADLNKQLALLSSISLVQNDKEHVNNVVESCKSIRSQMLHVMQPSIPELQRAVETLEPSLRQTQEQISELSANLNQFKSAPLLSDPSCALNDLIEISLKQEELRSLQSKAQNLIAELGQVVQRSAALQDDLRRTAQQAPGLMQSLQATTYNALQQRLSQQTDEHDAALALLGRFAQIQASQNLLPTLESHMKEIKNFEQEIRPVTRKKLACQSEIQFLEEHGTSPQEKEQLEDEREKLKSLAKQLNHLRQQKQSIIQSILGLRKTFPEVTVLAADVLPRFDDANGLIVKWKLEDYTDKKPLSPKVMKAIDPTGNPCVLKQFVLESSRESHQFQRELEILHKLHSLNHPLLIRLEAVFREGVVGYMQMPYYQCGSLDKWIKDAVRDDETIRRVLHQVCQAVSVLHRAEILHRDIKPQNVLIKEDNTPILIDFDVSKDVSGAEGGAGPTTFTHVGTFQYMAPEVLEGKAHSYASDMFSLGVLLYKILFNDRALDPEYKLPSHPNEHVVPLLSRLICREAKQRLSIEQVCVHPFFTSSATSRLQADGQLVAFDRKIVPFKTMTRKLAQQVCSSRIYVWIERSSCVQSVFENVKEEIGSVSPFIVTFEDEEGQDAGGLTTALYRLFFNQVLSPGQCLFEKQAGSTVYLPIPGADLDLMRVIGYMIVRCMFDERVVELPLSLSVWRYLLDLPLKHHDLEGVDPTFYHHLQGLLLDKHVADYGLDFDGLKPGGSSIDVTSWNVCEYFRLKTEQALVGCRQKELNALKEGFLSIAELAPSLKVFGPSEISILLCGEEFLSAEMVIAEIQFSHFDSSQTPFHLQKLLGSMTREQLRKFLVFVTEQPTVPIGGFPNLSEGTGTRKITVHRVANSSKLPCSHTCFLQLDLPDYNNYEVLKEKLLAAIEETSYGFC